MKKVLFTATVERHIVSFHLPHLKWFKDNGYEVHVATRGEGAIPYCDKFYNVCFERSPFKPANLKAYFRLKEIIGVNEYSLVHCHTPVGGLLTRLVSRRARENGTSVLYTAHGFHFFHGCSRMHWLLYYPIEWWLSKYTDAIITINQEDYCTVTKANFMSRKVYLINGVGVDIEKFKQKEFQDVSKLRREYGYSDNEFILLYAAELSFRKHQDLLIEVVDLLKDKIPNIKLLLAGSGDLEPEYRRKVELLGVRSHVDFLGYRDDVAYLMMISDIAVSSSRQEGLPVNVIESMAAGLPVVVTNCRGNRDLVVDGQNGFVVGDDIQSFASAIEKLYVSRVTRDSFGKRSLQLVAPYSLENVICQMEHVYSDLLS